MRKYRFELKDIKAGEFAVSIKSESLESAIRELREEYPTDYNVRNIITDSSFNEIL